MRILLRAVIAPAVAAVALTVPAGGRTQVVDGGWASITAIA